MIRLEVVPTSKSSKPRPLEPKWVVKRRGHGVVLRAFTKVEAVRAAAEYATVLGVPATVKIHLKTGEFQEERTYPRRADPRSTKG
jgi:hypothetical protein